MEMKLDELSGPRPLLFDELGHTNPSPSPYGIPILSINKERERSAAEIEFHPNTTLNWVYLMCSYGKKDDEFLGIRLDPRWRRETFTATKKLLSRLSKYGPFIQVEGDGTYYLATSGKRTLDELGIKDRPVIVVGLNAPPQRDPAGDESLTTVCNLTKSSKRSVGRGKTKRQQRPRSS
jgi:hypothetical protein